MTNCIICGDRANDEMLLISNNIDEIGSEIATGYPIRFGAILTAQKEYGQGKAHAACFNDHLREYGIEKAESFIEHWGGESQ